MLANEANFFRFFPRARRPEAVNSRPRGCAEARRPIRIRLVARRSWRAVLPNETQIFTRPELRRARMRSRSGNERGTRHRADYFRVRAGRGVRRRHHGCFYQDAGDPDHPGNCRNLRRSRPIGSTANGFLNGIVLIEKAVLVHAARLSSRRSPLRFGVYSVIRG